MTSRAVAASPPLASERVGLPRALAVSAGPPANAPRSASAPAAAALGESGFQVQLFAVPSSAVDAKKKWNRLRQHHEDLLADLSADVVRADLGPKGVYYRLQVGPLASREAARQLCIALASREQDCFIVSPLRAQPRNEARLVR